MSSVDITQRPKVVEKKERFGDLEIDLVIGANHKEIAEQLNIDFFFAKPYYSWQRGANENLNGLVRQFFPKKTNFDLI